MALSDRTALEIFRTIAKEFGSRDNSEVGIFLELAGSFVSEKVFAEKYQTGLAYMTAHLMTLSDRRGSAGSVTSERVGNVGVSYAPSSDSDDSLTATSYGVVFKSLRRLVTLTPVVRC